MVRIEAKTGSFFQRHAWKVLLVGVTGFLAIHASQLVRETQVKPTFQTP